MITDDDREAYVRYVTERTRRAFAGDAAPHAELLLETLEAHRELGQRQGSEATEAAIVAWLREFEAGWFFTDYASPGTKELARRFADQIAAGAHREG